VTATADQRPAGPAHHAHPGLVLRAVLADPVLSGLPRSELAGLLSAAAFSLGRGLLRTRGAHLHLAEAPRTGRPEDVTTAGTSPAASPQTVARPRLSRREQDVLRLYVSDLPTKSVARRLDIGEGSVKEYLKRIRRKYALLDRPAGTKLELYHRAREDGLISMAQSPAAAHRS
jgi:DNA-binding CsgD family transcriptional regulator